MDGNSRLQKLTFFTNGWEGLYQTFESELSGLQSFVFTNTKHNFHDIFLEVEYNEQLGPSHQLIKRYCNLNRKDKTADNVFHRNFILWGPSFESFERQLSLSWNPLAKFYFNFDNTCKTIVVLYFNQ